MASEYSNENIVFNANKNQKWTAGYYINQLKKFFAEVAPDATQEQKDRLEKLTRSIVMANCHDVKEKKRLNEEHIAEARTDCEAAEHSLRVLKLQTTQSENQVFYYAGLAKEKEAENKIGLEKVLKVGNEKKEALEARVNMVQETVRMTKEYDSKLEESETKHVLKVQTLKEEIEKLKIQKKNLSIS